MRIGIDATSLCRKLTGIEYYTLNLLKNILKIDGQNEYIIFFRKEIHPELKQFEGRAKFFVCPVNNRIFCEQVWLPYVIWKEKTDISHFPAFPPGMLNFKKQIITLFDAVIWKHPETLSLKAKFYLKPLIKLATKRASKILTVSESSKKDIATLSKILLEKVKNTGMAVGEIFRAINNKILLQEVQKKYDLNTKFILSVCSLEPRKNIINLLKAYEYLRMRHPGIPHKLVLTGRKAWGKNPISKEIKELKLKNDVIMTGYVSAEDLVCIYNLAEIFVFPSFYEGFGLPPLEAFACGTPVVSSNASSLAEVLGNAAFLVNPYDYKEIAEAINILISDPELRRRLIERGRERVKEFSWEKVAKKTLKIYLS